MVNVRNSSGTVVISVLTFFEFCLHLVTNINHTGFPLAFSHRFGNLTIPEFSSKWVRAACSGGWGQSDDS